MENFVNMQPLPAALPQRHDDRASKAGFWYEVMPIRHNDMHCMCYCTIPHAVVNSKGPL